MGNIGSGKTTLIDNIQKKYAKDIITFAEPIEQWADYLLFTKENAKEGNEALLQCIINDWFYDLKYNKIPDCKYNNKTIIIERSALESYFIFVRWYREQGLLNQMSEKYLKHLFERNKMNVDGYIYIKTSPETCIKRKIQRGREFENNDTKNDIKYWETIDKYYEDLYTNLKVQGRTVYTINGEQTIDNVICQFENIIANEQRK